MFKKINNWFKSLRSNPYEVPTGNTDADYWFTNELELAAMRGDPNAQGRLATAYHEGLGVERNPSRAFNFWLLAAKQGHAGAQAMISASYDTGSSIPKDPVEALFWASLSKAAKNPAGEALYDSLMRTLTFEQRQAAARLLVERTNFRP